MQHLPSGSYPSVAVESLRSKINRLNSLFLALEDLNTETARLTAGLALLVDIARTCDDLGSHQVFLNIKTKNIAEDRKAVRKLRSYSAICKILVRYSEQVPLFEKVEVAVVKIPVSPCPNVEPDSFMLGAIKDVCNTVQGGNLAAETKRRGFSDGAS